MNTHMHEQEGEATPAPAHQSLPAADRSASAASRTSSVLEEFLLVASRLNASIADLPIFADHSIGPANWALLKALESGPLSTDQLAQRANLSRQRVRVQVKELEAKQLLAVTRQDDGDRRARFVHILPEGTVTLHEISLWLEERGQMGNSKRLASAVKQITVLQRFFLQEKRARAREVRLQKLADHGPVTADA